MQAIEYAVAGRVAKAALRRAVKLAGSAAGLAVDLDISEGRLSKLQSPSYPDMLRADTALVIDSLVQAPVIVEAMARELGFRLVRRCSLDDSVATLDDLTRVLARTGDFNASFSGALADRIIDSHERRMLDSKIEQLIADLRNVQGKINSEAAS